jgi:hypothetical protein
MCIVTQSGEVMDGDVDLELYGIFRHIKIEPEGLVENLLYPAVEEEINEEGEESCRNRTSTNEDS